MTLREVAEAVGGLLALAVLCCGLALLVGVALGAGR